MKKKLEFKYLVIFMIPCIIFGLALFIYFPGILTYDSFNQLKQISNMKFNNAHPFFHTFIEMCLLKIWNNPAIIGIFQIIIFSLTWCIACKITNKEEEKKIYFMQIILTFIVSIIPLNFINSITLWKDILYSYAILEVTILIYYLLENKFKFDIKMCIFISFILMNIIFLRHNGKLVGIILGILFGIYIIKQNNKKNRQIILYFCVFVFMYVIFSLPSSIFDVSNESLSIGPKLLQAIGSFSSKGYLDKNDKDTIEKFCNIEKLNEVYTPYFVDIVSDSITNTNELNNNIINMVKIILKKSIIHPKTAIKYLLQSSSIIWRIDRPKNSSDFIYGTIICIDDYSESDANFCNIKLYNKEKNIYKNMNKIILYTLNNNLTRIILYSHGLMLYTQIVLSIIIVIIKKNIKYLLLLLPNLLNIMSLIISIPVQDVRYVYSTYLVCYFIILISIKEVFKIYELKKLTKHNKKLN